MFAIVYGLLESIRSIEAFDTFLPSSLFSSDGARISGTPDIAHFIPWF
jgi:hypothetical protein